MPEPSVWIPLPDIAYRPAISTEAGCASTPSSGFAEVTTPRRFSLSFVVIDAEKRDLSAVARRGGREATFPIEQTREALTLQGRRHVHGKVVITL